MLGILSHFLSHPLLRTVRSWVYRTLSSWRYNHSVQGKAGGITTVSGEGWEHDHSVRRRREDLRSRGFWQPQDGHFFSLLPYLGAWWVRGSTSQKLPRGRAGGCSVFAKAENHSLWAFTSMQGNRQLLEERPFHSEEASPAGQLSGVTGIAPQGQASNGILLGGL